MTVHDKASASSNEPVTISYTYRTVTAVDGHLQYFALEQPTRGLKIELAYGETDMDKVSILDFVASSREARVIRSADQVHDRTVRVEFEGWAFPRSGVAFIWSNENSAPLPPTPSSIAIHAPNENCCQ